MELLKTCDFFRVTLLYILSDRRKRSEKNCAKVVRIKCSIARG